MNNSPIQSSGPEQESARLYLGELIQLSDDLTHRSSRLRDDGRAILDDVLSSLRSLCISDERAPGPESNLCEFLEVQRDLQSSWLRVDSRIDDLLSSATDEIAQFVAVAESRIGACERAVRHQEHRKKLHENFGAAQPHADPVQDRVSSSKKDDQ